MYFPLRRNPRTAWARPSGAVRTLTRSRPPPAGPSERRHVKCRGRYPLQEPPFRLLELPGRRCDLREAKDDTHDDCTPDASLSSAAQCTFYSILPLHAPDSGKTTTSPSLLYMYTAPPCVYKRGRRSLSSPSGLFSTLGTTHKSTHALLSPDIGTRLNQLLL